MDPLTAVVLLSIAAAGGTVAILQMNADAIESVEVPLDVFASGSFPDVCVATGTPSETAVGIAERKGFRTGATGAVPTTKAQRAQYQGWVDIRRSMAMALAPLIVVVAVFQAVANNLIVDWATTIAVLAVAYFACFAHAAARRSVPTVESSDDLDAAPTITLRRVHPDFAEAVRSQLQSSA